MSIGTVLADNIMCTCYTLYTSSIAGDFYVQTAACNQKRKLHIIVRGNEKQILFEDSSDREKYLYLLKKYAAETEIS